MTNPTAVVIFGATGDLFRKKLAPALYKLFAKGQTPEVFRVAAFSRRPWGDDQFRQFLSDTLLEKSPNLPSETLKKFLEHFLYIEGDLGSSDSYQKVAEVLGRLDAEAGVCMNKLFYLATPPVSYEGILDHISTSGLAIPCAPVEVGEGWTPLEVRPDAASGRPAFYDGRLTGWTRILIEKPFGSDLKNAEKLDRLLGELFSETQIFRIDHYLAKETLQHILKFRFSDGAFEPFWNREHIEKIAIKLFEKEGINGRGAFYDALGALRDVGQNHALQMAALVAMEKPEDFSAAAVRAKRAAILKKFKLAKDAARAQYQGYKTEPGVSPSSTTETYFKIELGLATPRWRGVGFILESGKGLPQSYAAIEVYFKKPIEVTISGERVLAAAVKFKIQPKEEISIMRHSGNPAEIPFSTYGGAVGETKNEAYEKVLLDAIKGDQTLFTSTDEVVAEWKIVMPILAAWRKAAAPLLKYAKGTMPERRIDIEK
ncbi:MAG: glucose-6-phosphate dehydrogenase (NADP(+)) [Candidatus Taylorbacteria bacterium]|nr:glucose-6-phosphate dehydrogenase (NADP(+)) [Candidatus Taylorbacteria bacterium]